MLPSLPKLAMPGLWSGTEMEAYPTGFLPYALTLHKFSVYG